MSRHMYPINTNIENNMVYINLKHVHTVSYKSTSTDAYRITLELIGGGGYSFYAPTLDDAQAEVNNIISRIPV